ncbi:MAG: diphosphomevalonate decarboxylase, partial [Bdellovibrionales bacterium]|nr:diphosphomevalonate decarboxylase [Bdellovibrionales bacterium]
MLKDLWGIEGTYCVRSANNFPSDCGLASSASSFAALTLATAELARDKKPELANQLGATQLSQLSRKGSGSSCRSLFSGWALWRGEGAESVEFPMQNLIHQAVIVESGKKEVSSSEAHRRVTTSPHFAGRVERAEARLKDLTAALNKRDWKSGFEICWDEFQDMHQLFETSEPAFAYMTDTSRKVLKHVHEYWQKNQDGPWVTMDAGANVHLLYRENQRQMAEELKSELQGMAQVMDHG